MLKFLKSFLIFRSVGFQTVLPEPKPKAKPNNSFDSQNGQELLRQNNWLKVCCKCLTTRGDLLKCNGSCNGYYHLSCESTDSLETNGMFLNF